MKAKHAAVAVVMMAFAWMVSPNTTWSAQHREIVGLTPEQVPWFTPPYYKDGRQRAQMFGDSSRGGAWIDRVKIPGGMRVLAPSQQKKDRSYFRQAAMASS